MNPIFTSIAAAAIALAPFAASAVTLTTILGPSDYSQVDNSSNTATVGLPASASWTAAPTTVTGGNTSVARSPFDETPDLNSFSSSLPGAASLHYFAIGPNNPSNPAKLSFTQDQSSLSFLWGSPDDYNGLTFYLDGSPAGGPFNQSDVLSVYTPTTPPAESVYVTFSGVFDEVWFEASSNAFEFSSLSATPENPDPTGVSAPASLALIGGGLLAAGLVRRRR